MKHVLILLAMIGILGGRSEADDSLRVAAPGKRPADSRLDKPRTLDSYFPFQPPVTRMEWEARRQAVREQMLVAAGLWPMPPKASLAPVIHDSIDRGDYTIEKVFFTSYPGHYVSGNLYRPKGKTGKLPAVLCPHGHWPDGRLFDALKSYGAVYIQKQLKSGAEKTAEGARFPLQARCAQLARMGCVVFFYDMVGVADSKPIEHRAGFTDVDAALRLESFMGLQTFNSIRALDFLTSLPDVDPQRIGVTGASGGGTQTFMLCAIDDRPLAAFPAVMVSTAMQGGCVCENCCYLRIGTGNVELAGLFAPKPLGMSAANDWTKEIQTKGLPELKKLYQLYNAEDRVQASAFLQFDHNYNQVSREVMYNWFNKHLGLGQPGPVVEKPFSPVPVEQLSVYDAKYPRPADTADAQTLRRTMKDLSDRQLADLASKDEKSLEAFRRIVEPALRVMIGGGLPTGDEVEGKEVGDLVERDDLAWRRFSLSRSGAGEAVPAVGLKGKEFDGTVVIWIHPQGKASLFADGKLVPAAQRIVDSKAAIFAPDVFLTGEYEGAPVMPVDPNFCGFTFGYNRPLLAQRVHDILTAVAFVKKHERTRKVDLVGFDKAGPWVILARSLCGAAVERTAADLNQFSFASIRSADDEMMLPGALKYGDMDAFVRLCAPGHLFVHNRGNLEKASPEQMIDQTLR